MSFRTSNNLPVREIAHFTVLLKCFEEIIRTNHTNCNHFKAESDHKKYNLLRQVQDDNKYFTAVQFYFMYFSYFFLVVSRTFMELVGTIVYEQMQCNGKMEMSISNTFLV